MNIYGKLLEIQKRIIGLKKDKKSFSYSYVTGDKLLGFLKPIMNEVGLILKQEVVNVESERIKYVTGKGRDKDEVLYKVWLKFTWVDVETGEKDENTFFASGMNEYEKGLGSALTYAERYFLLKYFHIATDEDDIDNDKRKPEEAGDKPIVPKKENKPEATTDLKMKAYRKQVEQHFEKLKPEVSKNVLLKYDVPTILELTDEQVIDYKKKCKL